MDLGFYASQVDAVWSDEDGEITLVDHKTNNLGTFPGGEEGLREYLSWQLSCYAVMFEAQTGKKVRRLLANHIRHGEGRQWEIARKDDALVLKLLGTEATLVEGAWHYDNPEMQAADEPVRAVDWIITAEQANELSDMCRRIADIKRQADEAQAQADALKQHLLDLMSSRGVKTWDNDFFKATVRAPKASPKFDSKRFRDEHPDLWSEYAVDGAAPKPSLIVTLK